MNAKWCISLALLLVPFLLAAQETGTIKGVVKDKEGGIELIGVQILIKATSKGTVSGIDGSFIFTDVKPGDYVLEFRYMGYETQLITGIKVAAGETKSVNVEMGVTVYSPDEEIIVTGERPLVDPEKPSSGGEIGDELIAVMPARPVQGILNTATGVVNNAEGIHIRGGRSYETGFYIDGVSAQDPLSGTGFGIDLGSNAVNKIEVTTGGAGVEYGDATSGVVNTQTRTGGDKFNLNFTHKRDNLGFNGDWDMVWNNQVYELGLGGPAKFINKSEKIKGKLHYMATARLSFSDLFFKNPADQLYSSLYSDTISIFGQRPFLSPYQDNRWNGMFKLNYEFNPRKKLMVSYVKSININQDRNMLRITGNDVSFLPGYQYSFHLQPDNANTYTHDTNLETVQWQHTTSNQFSYKVSVSRLFVHLRADANGRDWRPESVDAELDPRSIVEYPAGYFNPQDSIVFVNPGPGLYNNGGIATLWHDHFVEEYTLNARGVLYSKNTLNRFTIGTQVKRQDMQWVDIIRPWIGAPLQLANGESSQSFRLGDLSEVWRAKPMRSAIFVEDKIKYRGLIAFVGARLEAWMPGSFVDNAIADSTSPIRDEIRQAYLDNSIGIGGNRRMKMRMLPKVSASFPIRENQVMHFNYGHSTKYPHPTFIYTGLDPFFTDQSTLSNLGNPNLDPEVDISYELGLKSNITLNDALNITAFWKDKYDFISTTSILVEDFTGRAVSRSMRINSDYARVRGLEIAYIKRVGRWFHGQISGSYSVATGQSSSSSESIREILATGNRESTKETYLAWDSPIDLKALSTFTLNRKEGLWGKKGLNQMLLYVEAIYRTGRRYTPYIYIGDEPTSGRPIYEVDGNPENRFSELSTGGFWLNTNFKKWFVVKKIELALTLEVTNLLNNKNTAIVNPVTGRAYEQGDPVPTEWRDPNYLDPRDFRSHNTPPYNPARYYETRHFMLGVTLKI